jgi:phenylacetate-CoA ligase
MPLASPFPSRRAISDHQFDELQAMMRLVGGNNPFYVRKLEIARSSSRLRHMGDFSDTIPFTTRQEIVEDFHAHPPFGSNLTFPLTRYVRCHQGRNARGQIWRWLDMAESWASILDHGAEVFHVAKVGPGDRAFFVSSGEEEAGSCLPLDSASRAGALGLSGAGLEPAAQWEAMRALGATVLCGSAASLARLVEAARQNGAKAAPPPVWLVLAGGQPGDMASVRERVMEIWPEARVFDHYAAAEAGVVAHECPARPGVLHVLEPAIFPEVIDPSTGEAVERGQTGELVLTTLFRPGSPLVRFRTGHLVQTSPETVCECGRQQLALEGFRQT